MHNFQLKIALCNHTFLKLVILNEYFFVIENFTVTLTIVLLSYFTCTFKLFKFNFSPNHSQISTLFTILIQGWFLQQNGL